MTKYIDIKFLMIYIYEEKMVHRYFGYRCDVSEWKY